MKHKILIYGLAAAFIISMTLGAPASAFGDTYGTYGNQSYGGASYSYGNMPSLTGMGIGSRGQNVVNLQLFLQGKGYLIMPRGVAYGYFGPATQNALYRYQLANGGTYGGTYPGTVYPYQGACPLGFALTTYEGVYGCFKFLNSSNNGYNYGNNYNDHNNNYRNSDDTTLSNFNATEGDDSDAEEGDDDVEIMEAEFDVEDGDARLERVQVDFEFTGDSDAEDKPWNVFDRVRLLIDGDEIDEIQADDSDEWTKEDSDTYRLTFASLDEILREDDTVTLTLEADIAGNIDGADNGDVSFELSIPDRGIRARGDNEDTVEIGDDSDTINVTVDDGNGSENNDRDDAEDAISEAEDAIDVARDEIDDANDDGEDVDKAENLLEDAEDSLDDAMNALDDSDYDEAVDLANDAEQLAEDAVDAIGD